MEVVEAIAAQFLEQAEESHKELDREWREKYETLERFVTPMLTPLHSPRNGPSVLLADLAIVDWAAAARENRDRRSSSLASSGGERRTPPQSEKSSRRPDAKSGKSPSQRGASRSPPCDEQQQAYWRTAAHVMQVRGESVHDAA
jgi:hypothetical protein